MHVTRYLDRTASRRRLQHLASTDPWKRFLRQRLDLRAPMARDRPNGPTVNRIPRSTHDVLVVQRQLPNRLLQRSKRLLCRQQRRILHVGGHPDRPPARFLLRHHQRYFHGRHVHRTLGDGSQRQSGLRQLTKYRKSHDGPACRGQYQAQPRSVSLGLQTIEALTDHFVSHFSYCPKASLAFQSKTVKEQAKNAFNSWKRTVIMVHYTNPLPLQGVFIRGGISADNRPGKSSKGHLIESSND